MSEAFPDASFWARASATDVRVELVGGPRDGDFVAVDLREVPTGWDSIELVLFVEAPEDVSVLGLIYATRRGIVRYRVDFESLRDQAPKAVFAEYIQE